MTNEFVKEWRRCQDLRKDLDKNFSDLSANFTYAIEDAEDKEGILKQDGYDFVETLCGDEADTFCTALDILKTVIKDPTIYQHINTVLVLQECLMKHRDELDKIVSHYYGYDD